MILDLPLARAVLDAATIERSREGFINELLGDPATRFIAMNTAGGIAVDERGHTLAAAVPEQIDEQVLVFLGRALPHVGLAGDAYVLAIGDALDGLEYRASRDVALASPEPERGLAVAASAVANWHAAYRRCGVCGGETTVVASGWVRHCESCGLNHFPRTDPAVIMAIFDENDRVLLAHASHFPARRYSMLAGFVEPGESLERAVVREAFEEAGVRVNRVEYQGSQAWPFPRSLMLTFNGWVDGCPEPIADGEEITDARFFSREDLEQAVEAGEVILPSEGSAARALLERWNGVPGT